MLLIPFVQRLKNPDGIFKGLISLCIIAINLFPGWSDKNNPIISMDERCFPDLLIPIPVAFEEHPGAVQE